MKDLNRYQQVEAQFIEEDFKNPDGHEIIDRQKKILLSAPHSVTQLRHGQEKTGEFRTGVIVNELGKQLDYPTVYKTKNLNDDANYDPASPYKTDVLNYVQQHDIKLLLDFHISKPERAFSFDIGSGRGQNILGREDLIQAIITSLKENYPSVKVDDTFPGSYPYTVSAIISKHAHIPAIQIEINWNIIDTFEKTHELINHMVQACQKLEEML